MKHKKPGELYVAGLPTKSKRNKFDLLVDGRPITTHERKDIEQYRTEEEEAKFLTIAIDNCINVESFQMYGVE